MRIEIYMSCPVCLQEGRNSPKEYWRDEPPCNGKLYIDEYAIVHCAGCGASAHLSQMGLRCNNNRHDFSIPSTEGFAAAISTSAQFVNGTGLRWLQSAIKYIGR